MAFELPWWRACNGSQLSDYTKEKRDLDYLAIAYGKMAYASAGGFDTVWGKNNLPATIAQESIDTDDTTTGQSGKKRKVTTEPIYEQVQGDKFRPKTHLVSLTTSGIPETFGAVQRGSYTYRSYGGLVQPPSPGTDISMAWGWAYGSKVLSGESFAGTVYGFDIQSNSEGGFDVTVKLIGKNTSVTVVGLSADQTIDVSSPNVTDANGNTYAATDIFSVIGICSTEAIDKPAGPITFNNGIVGLVAEVPENYDKPDTEPTTDNPSPMPKKAYVTFNSIVDLTNKLLNEYATGVKLEYATGYDSAPFASDIYSANPLEVLLPGKGKYGDKDFQVGGSSFGDTIQLPNIYIAADYVSKLGKAAITETSVGGSTEKILSLKRFYDELFKVINQNVGMPFSLTLTNSGDLNDKNIYIADMNNVQHIDPVNISAVRSANLSAALDSDQQAQYFVTARASSAIKNNTGNAVATKAKEAPSYDTLVNCVGLKANDSNVNALKAANKTKISNVLTQRSGFGTSAPWNLSVTLDGSGGWNYGGVITYNKAAVNNLVGNGYRVGFAISDVQHNVADGDWTVSLSTMCKIYK